jgi:tellurite resistance-related uncharacterized protein
VTPTDQVIDMVARAIVGFEQDAEGEWVAQLDCLHRRHVRHNPPFRWAAWVLDDDARSQRLGTELDCGRCDRAELPDGLAVERASATWTERTMPPGLRRAHRLAAGTWARLRIDQGLLRFRAMTEPVIDVVLDARSDQAIPPGVEHDVEPLGPVRFSVEFLTRADERA